LAHLPNLFGTHLLNYPALVCRTCHWSRVVVSIPACCAGDPGSIPGSSDEHFILSWSFHKSILTSS
jgi:hypothetical protein